MTATIIQEGVERRVRKAISALSSREINERINVLMLDIEQGRGVLPENRIDRMKQEAAICAKVWLKRRGL